jgi:hypothetical protein
MARGLLGVIACVVALAAPAGAEAMPGYFVVKPTLSHWVHLKGSHGYAIDVFASPGRVWIVTSKGSASASYLARGTVTEQAIEGRFGNLGWVSIQKAPGGWVERHSKQDGCRGKVPTTWRGRFIGIISFRGEMGFTHVHAESARGSTERSHRVVCKRHKGPVRPPRSEPPSISLGVISSRYPRTPWFSVYKQEIDPRLLRFSPTLDDAVYTTHAIERRANMGIVRSATAHSAPEAFAVSPIGANPLIATVTPPPPFSGSAAYEELPDGSALWSGNLTVELPGRSEIPLVDSTSRGELCRSMACACPIGECFFLTLGSLQARVRAATAAAPAPRPWRWPGSSR